MEAASTTTKVAKINRQALIFLRDGGNDVEGEESVEEPSLGMAEELVPESASI